MLTNFFIKFKLFDNNQNLDARFWIQKILLKKKYKTI